MAMAIPVLLSLISNQNGFKVVSARVNYFNANHSLLHMQFTILRFVQSMYRKPGLTSYFLHECIELKMW